MIFTVYAITGPEGREYVGCTSQPLTRRFEEHCRARPQTIDPRAIGHAINEHGRDAFTIRAIHEGLSFGDARRIEAAEIESRRQAGKPVYNLRVGGAGFGRIWRAVAA